MQGLEPKKASMLEFLSSAVVCAAVALIASVLIGFGLWLGVMAAETVLGG